MKKMCLFAFIFLVACTGQVPQVAATHSAEVTATFLPLTATSTPLPTSTTTPLPTQEVVKTPRGLELTIGDPIVGQEDVFLIENIKDGKDLVALNGDTQLGFKSEDNQWVYIKGEGETYRIVLQRVSDGIEIGELKLSGNIEWNWNELNDESDLNILLKGGKKYDVANLDAYRLEQGNMLEAVLPDLHLNGATVTLDSYFLYSRDRQQVVVLSFLQRGDNPQAGYVIVKGVDRNPPIVLWVEDFDLSLPRSRQPLDFFNLLVLREV